MDNTSIAKIFENIANLLELKGDIPFKIRAYQRAARTIEHLPAPVSQLAAEGRLRELPGIGQELEEKIHEMLTTGDLVYYQRLYSEFPEGIIHVMGVPGVGPKTASRLWKELGVTTVDELERAVEDGRVAALPRMGEKTAENILRQLRASRTKDQRVPIGHALPVAQEIIAALSPTPGLRNLTAAGSLRRYRETVGDVDIIGTSDDPEPAIKRFTSLPLVSEVIMAGPQRASVRLGNGLQVDLRLVPHDAFGSLLQHFTGSQAHNVVLREYAVKKGLSVSEYGITRADTGERESFSEEEAVYTRLGLQYIPPEIREGGVEIELAERGSIPRLVELSDIKGDLHDHTIWSDGHNTTEEMVEAARARGYQYIAITDHSAGRGIANGLSVERLREHIKEIRALNERYGDIRIFTGSEVDIRADGSLDYPDEVLAELDVVVASVHSAMGQEAARMTERIIKAMHNPHVDIIGHLTCRLLGEREPVALDSEAIFRAAAATGTALEINASPSRLDLKDTHIHRARELGVMLVSSTDAHRVEHLDYMRFGVGIARRGWCEPSHILNTRPIAGVDAFFGPGR